MPPRSPEKEAEGRWTPHPVELESPGFCLVPQPREAEPKDSRRRRLTSSARENPQPGPGRRRKTEAWVLLPLRPPNPHRRTRNSLRFSKGGASAKCNRARSRGNRQMCQAGPAPRERNPKWATAKRGRNAAGLPNRELQALRWLGHPTVGQRGGGRAGWQARAQPEHKASFPGLGPSLEPRAHLCVPGASSGLCSGPWSQPCPWKDPGWRGRLSPGPSASAGQTAGVWLP